MPFRLPFAVVFALLFAACAVRPSRLLVDDHMVVVKSVRLPDRSWLPWYTRFAEHAWVEIATPRGVERVEWNKGAFGILHSEIGRSGLIADERWERPVAVHATWRGDAARTLGERILAVCDTYPDARGYRAWPGPNSNTFMAWLARETGMGVDLPPNAVGRDYTQWLAVGASTTGLGLRVDTPILGAGAGLVEGVELHALGLTAGVGLWPPSLKVPFLPAIPGGWFAPWSEPVPEPGP
ncbi:MAG: DUF3750 domain-containing protein [Planctomycetes bacterium]|nr:DUF3750 domain-containing protein [Planctomycetota bacterium]